MQHTQRSLDTAMFWKLQEVLHENTLLKSGEQYEKLRSQAMNAEKRAQAAEATAESLRRKLFDAERKADAAYGRGMREGMYHGETMQKEAYRVIDKNNADCAKLVKEAEDKRQKAEAEQRKAEKALDAEKDAHRKLQEKYDELERRYDSLWDRHFGQCSQGVQSTQTSQATQSAQQAQSIQGAQCAQNSQGVQSTHPSQTTQGVQSAQQTIQGAQSAQNSQGAQSTHPSQTTQGAQSAQRGKGSAGTCRSRKGKNSQASQATQPAQTAQQPQPIQGAQSAQNSQGAQSTHLSQTAQGAQPAQQGNGSAGTCRSRKGKNSQTSQATQPAQTAQQSQPVQGTQSAQNSQGAQFTPPSQTAQGAQSAQQGKGPAGTCRSRKGKNSRASQATQPAQTAQQSQPVQGTQSAQNSLGAQPTPPSQTAQGAQPAQQGKGSAGTRRPRKGKNSKGVQSAQIGLEPESEESAQCQKLREDNYRLRQELEEMAAEKDKLEAQLQQNSSNSNIPSSKCMRFGPIQAHREPSSRGQGGQPGHPGHKRKRLEPQETIMVAVDPAIQGNPEYEFLEYRVKQKIGIRITAHAVDYVFPVYRNRATGKTYHPDFPEDLINEVNYDESVKAIIFLMKNYLNAAERKISNFISALTNGALAPSKGYINTVNEDFSNRTIAEREEIFNRLTAGKILHTDMTSLAVNGNLTQVAINTNGTDYLFQVREHKGIEAQKGTPLEHFRDTVISDGDISITHFGKRWQRCLSHILRPFDIIAEIEPYLTWHLKMRDLLSDAIKERNKSPDHTFTQQRQDEIEAEYDRIIELAEEEYKKYPPRKNGFTLGRAHYLDLKKNKERILLFIHDPTVPTTNALAELGARWLKRYMANAGTFRGKTGTASAEDYCDSQSVFVSLKNRVGYGCELFDGIKQRFTQARTMSKRRHFKIRRKEYEQKLVEKAREEAEKAARQKAKEEKKAQKKAEEAERRKQDALARGQAAISA